MFAKCGNGTWAYVPATSRLTQKAANVPISTLEEPFRREESNSRQSIQHKTFASIAL